jgi:hypothetical protein
MVVDRPGMKDCIEVVDVVVNYTAAIGPSLLSFRTTKKLGERCQQSRLSGAIFLIVLPLT